MPLLLRLGRLLVAAALAFSLSACGSGGGSAARTSDTPAIRAPTQLGREHGSGSDDESDLQSDLESDFDSDSASDSPPTSPRPDPTSPRSRRSRRRATSAPTTSPSKGRSPDGRSRARLSWSRSHHHRCAVRQRRQRAGLLLVVGESDRGTRHRRHSWGTSAGCLSGTSVGFDLAFVDVTGDTVVPTRSEPGSVSTAGFNATSGVVAQIYQVTGGSIELQFSGTYRLRHHRTQRVLRAVHGRRRRQWRLLQRNPVRLLTVTRLWKRRAIALPTCAALDPRSLDFV